MKKAFTLAEVLITLGIIGVVAAMTLPTLIQDYKNKVVETRLAHFYSVMNQAIRLSEVENGDKSYWFNEHAGGWNEDHTENAKLVWLEKYILPYMNGVKCVIHDDMYQELPVCYLPNGGAFASYNTAVNRDWIYWTGDPRKCNPHHTENIGTCSFAFFYNPNSKSNSLKNSIEPWKLGWDGTKEMLYRECMNNEETYDRPCAAIIQYNGWKIPDDYPYKVRY